LIFSRFGGPDLTQRARERHEDTEGATATAKDYRRDAEDAEKTYAKDLTQSSQRNSGGHGGSNG
jgi:hypothetical protein